MNPPRGRGMQGAEALTLEACDGERCEFMKTFFIWLFGIVICGFVGALVGEYLYDDGKFTGFIVGLAAFACFKLWVVPERTNRYGTGGFDE